MKRCVSEFPDKSRLDVLLQDPRRNSCDRRCGTGNPYAERFKQVRKYMVRLRRETKRSVRGILVDGGARKLGSEMKRAASKAPRVEIMQYKLDVDFAPCGSDLFECRLSERIKEAKS